MSVLSLLTLFIIGVNTVLGISDPFIPLATCGGLGAVGEDDIGGGGLESGVD
jgi:hypothetical protein